MQTKYPIFAIDLYSDAGFAHNQQSKLATLDTYDDLINAIRVSVKGKNTVSKAVPADGGAEVIIPASMTIKLHRYDCVSSLEYQQDFAGNFTEKLHVFAEPSLVDDMLNFVNETA